MKNIDLAKKIKELRSRKGFSQEELATKSGLNLRTIQRIEAGETEPRGDTLQRLGDSLNITPDELVDWTVQENNGYLVALNLSALSYIAFPIFGILIPLIFWLMNKDKIKGVKETGKKLLNFQITWAIAICFIYLFLLLSVFIPIKVSNFDFQFMNLGVVELLAVFFPICYYGFNFILIITNSIRLHQHKNVFYPLSIKFLR